MRTARRLKTAPAVRPALPTRRDLTDELKVWQSQTEDGIRQIIEALKNEPATLAAKVVPALIQVRDAARRAGTIEGVMLKPGSYQARRRNR